MHVRGTADLPVPPPNQPGHIRGYAQPPFVHPNAQHSGPYPPPMSYYHTMPYYPPFGYHVPPTLGPQHPVEQLSGSSSVPSSQDTTTSHNVTLEMFCNKYKISPKDMEHLKAIEYTPGNKLISSLSDADWKDAGFSILGWQGFLAAHAKFCKAIWNGMWNTDT